MGSFQCSGIAEVAMRFDKMAKGTENACRQAVQAGARVLRDKLSEAAPVDTGALAASIRAGSVQYSEGDGFHSVVRPSGQNHGQDLALIGNVLEYGRSNMAPRPWFMNTVRDAAGEVEQTMAATFNAAAGA